MLDTCSRRLPFHWSLRSFFYRSELDSNATPGPEACCNIYSVGPTIWKVQRTVSLRTGIFVNATFHSLHQLCQGALVVFKELATWQRQVLVSRCQTHERHSVFLSVSEMNVVKYMERLAVMVTNMALQLFWLQYLTKQTAALREVNDSRLRIYEQLEVSIQDLERGNQRLVLENSSDKKHIKRYCSSHFAVLLSDVL
ncbi:hypothetical protein PR048_017252 [Dryococelus australis]|uniref:Uncharacterized protein n=1 Tax=Dryococelus australis TaxID=614101 RepID=A0ABQ9H951_9NEOP|nr:hypothetical protein PR048_017252 [Dryococelus australis]